MKWAENSLGRQWKWDGEKYKKKADDVKYVDGGPMDPDVRDTMNHLRAQEAIHGVYELPPKDEFKFWTNFS